MKRILSVILSLCMVASLFAGLSISASATTADYYKSQLLGSDTDGQRHQTWNTNNTNKLSVPTENSVVEKAPTISYWKYDAEAGTSTMEKTWFNKTKSDVSRLYDESGTAGTLEAWYDNGKNWTYVKTEAADSESGFADYNSVDDGSFYMQIQYDFDDCYGNGINLDKVVVFGFQRMWTMGSYDLFISNDLETLYDEPVYSYNYLELNGKELAGYADAAKNYSTYSFAEGTTAKFVAIRIYKTHALTEAGFDSQIIKKENGVQTGVTPATARPRINEFNVYGTRSTANDQNYELTAAAFTSTGGDQTLTAATAAGIGTNISTSLIRDYAPTEYKYSNLGSTTTATVSDKKITQSNDFKRYDVNTNVRYAGTNSKGYKYIIDNENNYQQWIYALDAAANIDSIVVATNHNGTYANTNGTLFAPYHVKYSLADNKDDLFVDGASTTYDVYNTDASAFLTINLTEAVTAKYVGFRVVCGVNKLYPYTDYVAITGNNVAWARLSYFGVNGTYANPADATVNVEKDDAVEAFGDIEVSVSAPSYSGNTDTNSAYPAGTVTVSATEQYDDNVGKKSYKFASWNDANGIYNTNASFDYDLTKEDTTLTATYDECAFIYNIDFIDGTGKVIGTLNLEEGTEITPEMMASINSEVKDIYGYEIVLDENELVAWNDGVYGSIVAGSKTYYARYRNLSYQTAVTVTKVDGTKEYDNVNVAFDTAITVTDDAAAAWEMDGAVVATGTELKLYAAGTTMNVTATAEAKTADELAFVGKAMDNGNFSVFVHVNPTKTVKAYGVIFGSNTYKNTYDAQDEDVKATMFKLDDTAAFEKTETKKPSLTDNRVTVTNAANVDYMTSLTDVATNLDGTYKTRHARAYVIYSDDSVVYSDVIISNK